MVLTEMPWVSRARAQRRELLGTDGADVGLPVGQQHDAVEPPRLLELRHLDCALQHAGVDGRRAAHADLLDEVREMCGVADRLRRHQHVDRMIEDDDGGDVGRQQPVDGHDRRLARLGDAGALHGARAVDDEGHVDGRARLRGLGLAALQRDAQVVLVPLAALHDWLRQPRLELDRLIRPGGRQRQRHGAESNVQTPMARASMALSPRLGLLAPSVRPGSWRKWGGKVSGLERLSRS